MRPVICQPAYATQMQAWRAADNAAKHGDCIQLLQYCGVQIQILYLNAISLYYILYLLNFSDHSNAFY